ncbi:hypothetical protein MKZ38_001206 [Zalerion maritima]|uniref:Uncharacterized protein n=1 Tax=Zalerion maritima TaxID=339359 RepID=A0AAD5S5J7_9PEZI|nr:hypothetical protein MKZ38_001206 [Zalerion maritima]
MRTAPILALSVGLTAAHPLDSKVRRNNDEEPVNCNDLPIGQRCMAIELPDQFPDLSECSFDPIWILNSDDGRLIKENEIFKLEKKSEMAYIVSNGAHLTLNNIDITKTSETSNDIEAIDGPAIPPLATVDGGVVTVLHGSIVTNDTPGQIAYSGGEGSELHLQYLDIATSGIVSYGVVSSDFGGIYARSVRPSSSGYFDCAFSAGKDGILHLNEFASTTCHGPLVCSFEGQSEIHVTHVTHTSSDWPVLFLKDSPAVMITDSDLRTTVEDRPVICNYVDAGSSPGTKIEIVDTKLTAPTNGAIFELRNSGAKVWLTHSEAVADHADFVWARCGLDDAGSCEGPIKVDVFVADSKAHGDVVAWDNSIINLSIDPYSSWIGSTAWPASTGPSVNLVVDGSWELTRDTYVQQLVSRRANLENIVSHGHTVYYNPDLDENAYLEARDISLPDGGWAKPFAFTSTAPTEEPSLEKVESEEDGFEENSGDESEDEQPRDTDATITASESILTMTVFTTIMDDDMAQSQVAETTPEEPAPTEEGSSASDGDRGDDGSATEDDGDVGDPSRCGETDGPEPTETDSDWWICDEDARQTYPHCADAPCTCTIDGGGIAAGGCPCTETATPTPTT